MKRLLALLILLGILTAAILYNLRARSAPPALPAEQNGSGAIPVTAGVAERRAIRQTLALVGVLRADRQAAISAKVPGRILAVLVRDGDRVRRGQPLVRMDIGDAQAQVAGAQAGIRAAQAQYRKAIDGKRAREVEQDALIAQARGGLAVAQAKLKQAELGVTLTRSAADSDSERAAAAVRQAEAGLKQAEAGLTQAEETLRRMKFLYAHGGIARVDLEGAQAQADIAQAARDAALAGLEQARAAAKPAAETIPLRAQVSQADVDSARAGVRQAEEGLRSAYRAKAEALRIADRDIEAASAQVEQARSGGRQAAAQVGDGTLTSPLDGVVTDLTIQSGEMAQPGSPLMSVVAPGSVFLEASAPARYADLLRPGQIARVTVDTLPGEPMNGMVKEVLPVSGSDNRSVPVRIRLEPDGARLMPGAMAKADLELSGSENALVVPVDALRNEGNVTFVYIIVDNKAQRHNLTLGATEGSYVQVLSGLKPGDPVILSGSTSLQSGAPVQVVGR
jgi:HlyD family secretion protein